MTDERPEAGENSERQELLSRRSFFSRISIVAGALAGAIVSVPILGFVFGPLTRSSEGDWQAVGPIGEFAIGETVLVTFQDPASLEWSGQVGEQTAWLQRRGEEEFVAYSHFCTHLGCPVFWLPEARLFMCPCHGGTFYENGEVAVEPPQKPLTQFAVRLRDGQVEIRTRAAETAA